MVLLDNGKFLTELHKLYDANKGRTVWVTMKRSEWCTPRGWERCWWPVAARAPPPRAPAPTAPPPLPRPDRSPQAT